jgi:hypothetical protein
MIRVTKPIFDEIDTYVRYYTDDYDTSVTFTCLPTWDELEPAPPKCCPYLDLRTKDDVMCMHPHANAWGKNDSCDCIHEQRDWWNCGVLVRWRELL